MTKAYVLIANESGTDDSVIVSLRDIPSITNVYGTFGSYDLLTKLESSNEQIIQNDILNGITKIDNIKATLTLLVDGSGIQKTTKIEQEILDTHMSHAYVVIRCLNSNKNHIMKKLEEIVEMIEAYTLIGTFDIICKITAPTYNDLSDIISNKIRTISEITSTNTINVINQQGFDKNSK
jgi:DNA-binding Lrp family transcriptional regulator